MDQQFNTPQDFRAQSSLPSAPTTVQPSQNMAGTSNPVQQPGSTASAYLAQQGLIPPANVGITQVPENTEDDKTIEEGWVAKAKALVDQTQSDPYKEADAISRLKAEYLSSRHNKIVKVKDVPTS